MELMKVAICFNTVHSLVNCENISMFGFTRLFLTHLLEMWLNGIKTFLSLNITVASLKLSCLCGGGIYGRLEITSSIRMKLLISIAPFSRLCLFHSYGFVTGIGNIITSGKIGSFVPCLMVKVVASCYVFHATCVWLHCGYFVFLWIFLCLVRFVLLAVCIWLLPRDMVGSTSKTLRGENRWLGPRWLGIFLVSHRNWHEFFHSFCGPRS